MLNFANLLWFSFDFNFWNLNFVNFSNFSMPFQVTLTNLYHLLNDSNFFSSFPYFLFQLIDFFQQTCILFVYKLSCSYSLITNLYIELAVRLVSVKVFNHVLAIQIVIISKFCCYLGEWRPCVFFTNDYEEYNHPIYFFAKNL
jgi:hypothetical protein